MQHMLYYTFFLDYFAKAVYEEMYKMAVVNQLQVFNVLETFWSLDKSVFGYTFRSCYIREMLIMNNTCMHIV